MATMTVGEAITALNDAKTAIANAITAKGGTVGQGDGFADFATDIGTISGGGGSSKLPSVVDRSVTTITADDLQGATKIGSYAFFGCRSLTSLQMPNGITTIQDSACQSCVLLATVAFPTTGFTGIQSSAFKGCTSLNNIILPSSLTSIAMNCFEGCTSLTSISLPNGVTNAYSNSFKGCTALTTVTILGRVTAIGGSAFEGCSALTSITFPNASNCTINANAFKNCSSLTAITIPSGVSSIANYAFSGAGTSVNKLTVTMTRATPPSIYSLTFDTNTLGKIRIPSAYVSAYSSATNWSALTSYFEAY